MSETPVDPPSALEQVVDDYAPRRAAVEWAVAELTNGRSFDEVAAQLAQNGWGDVDVDEIVEEARQHTRALRGVVTRHDIVYGADQRYQQGMRGSWLTGCFPTVATAMRLIGALRNLATFRRFRRRDGDDRDG